MTALGLPASQLKKKKKEELHWVSQRVNRRRRRRVNCTGSPRSPKVEVKQKRLFGFWFGSSKHRKQNWRRNKKRVEFPSQTPPLLKQVDGQLTRVRCSSYNYSSYPIRTKPPFWFFSALSLKPNQELSTGLNRNSLSQRLRIKPP